MRCLIRIRSTRYAAPPESAAPMLPRLSAAPVLSQSSIGASSAEPAPSSELKSGSTAGDGML